MAVKKKRARGRQSATQSNPQAGPLAPACSAPPRKERTFDPAVTAEREMLIRRIDALWSNGTTLRYHFMDLPKYSGTTAERKAVRKAFKMWKDVGVGLEFKEVSSAHEAEIRIAFEKNGRSWSYLGRGILDHGPAAPTMNLGWSVVNDIDTAVHEIGHTLGFPHEHQNPHSGIAWDEQAVLDYFSGPPNHWDEDTTRYNVLRKIQPDSVQGSKWDPNSIMHYSFQPGLIAQPPQYGTNGLWPKPGLSPRDKKWAKTFYPVIKKGEYCPLEPFEFERLHIGPGEQAHFEITPDATRRYRISTFGLSDSVMVLFEDVDGELRFRDGDDDSGIARNAKIEPKLFAGRRYVLRLRLYYQHREGDLGVLMW